MSRDLRADLQICEAMSGRRWHVRYGSSHPAIYADDGAPVATVSNSAQSRFPEQRRANAEGIAAAREGWPEAIRRAMAAEERVVKLEAALRLALQALTDGMEDVPPGHRSPRCAKLRAEAKRAIRQLLGPKPDSEEG